MCCFAGSEEVEVSSTNIFARMLDGSRQALAYSMDLFVGNEVAMVLPLPVAPHSGDDAIAFVDLTTHAEMFHDLARLFAIPTLGDDDEFGLPQGLSDKLEVHHVGSFVASYVPTRADFARLDRRFRISGALFDAVPHYADYGFAVFQLAPGRSTIHPMAFSFPTRHPDHLFFPTVHVHDGRFHPTAHFDHSLYYQHPRATELGEPFGPDSTSFERVADTYAGLVRRNHPVVRRELHGHYQNEDVWIPLG